MDGTMRGAYKVPLFPRISLESAPLWVGGALESAISRRPVFNFTFELLVFRKADFPKTVATTTIWRNLAVFANIYYSHGPRVDSI